MAPLVYRAILIGALTCAVADRALAAPAPAATASPSPAAAPATILTTGDAAALAIVLLQRVSEVKGQPPLRVWIGKLPEAWNLNVPLPADAKLIGALAREGVSYTQLYYETKAEAAEAARGYAKQLVAGGYVAKTPFGLSQGGFETASPALYCGKGNTIAVYFAPGFGKDTHDLQIAVLATGSSTSPSPCSGAVDLFTAQRSPLPSLTAPPGVTMTIGQAGAGSSSGAKLDTSAPLATVMEALTGQFTNAGWSVLDRASAAGVATTSFAFTDEKKVHWQAVLTLYASAGARGTYYAFVDVTNLTTEAGTKVSRL